MARHLWWKAFSFKLGHERHTGFCPQTTQWLRVLGNEMNQRSKTLHFCVSFMLERIDFAQHKISTKISELTFVHTFFPPECLVLKVKWWLFECKWWGRILFPRMLSKKVCHLKCLKLQKEPAALAMWAPLWDSAWMLHRILRHTAPRHGHGTI